MRKLFIICAFLLSACSSQTTVTQVQPVKEFNATEAAKTRISLGLTYLKNGNFKQAKFNLDKALQFAPELSDSHLGLGYYFQQVGENALADNAYKKALSLSPENPDIANSYGAFLCQAGEYQRAKGYFLKAIENPKYIRASESYENLALCSQNQGLKVEAIQYLKNALSHDPARRKSLVILVQLLLEEEQWKEARQYLMQYEKVGSVSAETLWFWVRIERGLGNIEKSDAYGRMLLQMYPQHSHSKDYLALKVKPVHKPVKAKIKPSPEVQDSVPPNDKPVVDNVSAVVNSATTVEKDADVEEDDTATYSENDQSMVTAEAAPPKVAPRTPKPFTEVLKEQQRSVADKTNDAAINSTTTKTSELTHVVRDGENLYRISLKYNVRMDKLMEWNNITDASEIHTGMTLRVSAP